MQWLPYAVVLLDAELHIVLTNRTASLLFSTPAERLRGVSIGALVPESNLGGLLRDLNERPKEIEICLQTNGGPARTLKITAVGLSSWAAIDGSLGTGATTQQFKLLVLQDISDKATLEQLLVETEKQAAMGQLAAGILHEVANPLTSIGSNLLFVRSMLTHAADEVVQALSMSLEHLEQMRQLLGTLSGLPGRAAAPKYELADLHEVIRRCVTFVAKEAERRRIRLAVSFAPSMVDCEMDVRLIKQVLLNLLKNAMEAMPEGGRLEVRTSYRPPEQLEPAAIVIEVDDTGLGIAEADLRKVFRPLFSTKPRGAGLGLSFCRQAVEEHGGEIRLTSRGRNQGTVAVVSLPVRQAVTADE